ncbi:MAG: hypothetical protein IPJ88_11470 [Myxococcales bacterium]|nr:MAG: hypothetical protein IPJ88_11470 [Myxococcales bacterium]
MIEKWLAFLSSANKDPQERATRPSFPHSDTWHRYKNQDLEAKRSVGPSEAPGDEESQERHTIPVEPLIAIWRRRKLGFSNTQYQLAPEENESKG